MSDHQESLKSESEEHSQVKLGPVTCLGMTFENDDARRAHFIGELCKKLQEPEFRKDRRFPHRQRRGYPEFKRPAVLHRLSKSLDW